MGPEEVVRYNAVAAPTRSRWFRVRLTGASSIQVAPNRSWTARGRERGVEMVLSDERVIEFFSKSPIRSFVAMLDSLRYLDGNWIWEELEYELFDEALGDNPEERLQIRVPAIRGIAAHALFAFSQHAAAFHFVRRRPRSVQGFAGQPQEIIVFYELTPAGRYMVKLLEALQGAVDTQSRVSV